MAKVIHFEIPVDKPDRAQKFYQQVFGWKIDKWAGGGEMDYWVVTAGEADEPGTNGALMPRSKDVKCTVVWVGVDDIDAALAKLKASGGVQMMDKQEVPGVGWTAYCKDTEGNVIGIIQPNPNMM